MRSSSKDRGWTVLIGLLWLGGTLAGFAFLWAYTFRPCDAAAAPASWPPGVPPRLATDRPTMVLFAHPRCPCTRATIEQLDRLLAREPGPVRVHVVFYRDPTALDGWERTDLWDHVERLPGVETHVDAGGTLASRFGVRTSGQVLLYDSAGVRRFAGGITASRGHVGDSRASDALSSRIAGDVVEPVEFPIYGCELFSSDEP